MASPINCDVLKIISPIWENLTQSQKDTISQLLVKDTEIVGNVGSRRGLLSVKSFENFVIGFYVEEDMRNSLQSDEGGPSTKKLLPNFEKLFLF